MYEEADKDRSEFPDWDGHADLEDLKRNIEDLEDFEEDPGRYVIIGDCIFDCGPSK